MKKRDVCIGLFLGMGAGAMLYSYSKKHPLKMMKLENKVKDMMKDY